MCGRAATASLHGDEPRSGPRGPAPTFKVGAGERGLAEVLCIAVWASHLCQMLWLEVVVLHYRSTRHTNREEGAKES